MDFVDLAAASFFLNSFVYIMAQACCAYLELDACLGKRRSVLIFWVYFALKAFVWSCADCIVHSIGISGDIQVLSTFGIAVISVVTYLVLYYTWSGSFCKVGAVAVGVDLLTAPLFMGLVWSAHELFGCFPNGDYRDYFGPWTIAVAVGGMLAIKALLALGKPVTDWVKGHDFVHVRMWTALFIVAVALTSVTRVPVGKAYPFLESTYLPIGVAALAAVAVIVFLAFRFRIEARRAKLLAQACALVKGYDSAIVEQLEALGSLRRQIDSMATEMPVDADGTGGTRAWSECMQRLTRACDALCCGTYSNCAALDAVLVSNREVLAANGVKAEFCVSSLGHDSVRAPLVAQTMLDWVKESYGHGRGKEDGFTAKGNEVHLRISRWANQLLFSLEAPSKKRLGFSSALLESCCQKTACTVVHDDDGKRKLVRVLVEQ